MSRYRELSAQGPLQEPENVSLPGTDCYRSAHIVRFLSGFCAAMRARTTQTVTVIGTRTERSLEEVSTTVTVKTADDIERELARDITDLVRCEPVVTVAGAASRFGLTGFNIRGIGANRLLTTIDGIRVPEEFGFGPFLISRGDFLDIDSLSRAEIAWGAISSLYGSLTFAKKQSKNNILQGFRRWHTIWRTGFLHPGRCGLS